MRLFQRQRNTVLSKYRKVYQAYTDLQAGLQRAEQFYEEMRDTVDSLKKNVDSFVENRRSEGGQLLSAIEAAKGSGADREQARLKELMERMSVSPGTQHSHSPITSGSSEHRRPPPLQYGSQQQQQPGGYNPARSPPITPNYQSNGHPQAQYPSFQQQQQQGQNGYPPRRESYQQGGSQSYNPHTYGPVSPPAHQPILQPTPEPAVSAAPAALHDHLWNASAAATTGLRTSGTAGLATPASSAWAAAEPGLRCVAGFAVSKWARRLRCRSATAPAGR